MKSLWRGWKKITTCIGSFNATLVFSLLYFILVTPLGRAMSLFQDPLNLKEKPHWVRADLNPKDIKEMSF